MPFEKLRLFFQHVQKPADLIEYNALIDLLLALHRKQISLDPYDQYLSQHGKRSWIETTVRTFYWYLPYLPNKGNILDWGCNHAPDSCLLRDRFGSRLNLFGCDFVEDNRYSVFYDFADICYTRLGDQFTLPYSSNFFDAIIASGVVEHTENDIESLEQLNRIIKVDGILVISHLPNWLSYGEWIRRNVWKSDYHSRLYRLGSTKKLLKRTGFHVINAGYHTTFWGRLLTYAGVQNHRLIELANSIRWLFPIHPISSSFRFIVKKMADV